MLSLGCEFDSKISPQLAWEAVNSTLEQNQILHWLVEICMLYPGDSLGSQPTQLLYHPKGLSAETYGQLAGSLRH